MGRGVVAEGDSVEIHDDRSNVVQSQLFRLGATDRREFRQLAKINVDLQQIQYNFTHGTHRYFTQLLGG